MATGGPLGGAGGVSGLTLAATRIDVVDPHILTPMRDVMSDAETAPRLKSGPGAGGGGGGGGGASGISTGGNGQAGETPSAVTNAIVKGVAGYGDGGAGGVGGSGGQYSGGGGGGGAGGYGGAVVLITTKASTTGSISVNPGSAGQGATSVSGQPGQNAESGAHGKIVHIIV